MAIIRALRKVIRHLFSYDAMVEKWEQDNGAENV